MKKIRRILSTVLVLAAILSCTAPGAFAASESTLIQYGVRDEIGYGGYMAFGDSVTRGVVAESLYVNDYYFFTEYRNVTNAYPNLLRQKIGCIAPEMMMGQDGKLLDATYWPTCYSGQTLNTMMRWLGITERKDKSDFLWDNWPDFQKAYGTVDNLVEKLKTCSLITVELGMCDVLFCSLLGLIDEGVQVARLEDVLGAAMGEMDAEKIGRVVEEVYTNFEYWKEEYPQFINFLRTQNPDATIVMVGAYNMAEGLRLSNDSVLPIGNALAAVTSLMNQQYQKWAQEYARLDGNIFFADISNVETPILQNGFALDNTSMFDASMSCCHPTKEGYAYICRQIISALPDDPAIVDPVCPLEPIINVFNNDIKLDLGRFDHVNYVLLDGKTAKYSMNNKENPFELTVHCNRRTAKNLTVVVVQKDGNVATYTYQLSNKDGEYSAYRIYSTNNTIKTASTLLRSVANIGTSILKAFAGLFAKK